jgi:hypothetical protein
MFFCSEYSRAVVSKEWGAHSGGGGVSSGSEGYSGKVIFYNLIIIILRMSEI